MRILLLSGSNLLNSTTATPCEQTTSAATAVQQARVHESKYVAQNGTDIRNAQQKQWYTNQCITNAGDLPFPTKTETKKSIEIGTEMKHFSLPRRRGDVSIANRGDHCDSK